MADLCEATRLEALRSYDILDSAPETVFDDLARLAAQVCETPMAMVSLVDEGRVWFKARLGIDLGIDLSVDPGMEQSLDLGQQSREASFCTHALGHPDVLVVPDARLDARFADLPSVTGEPGVRFYAGAPLVDVAGNALGTLCVLDTVPRTLTALQAEQLTALAQQVMDQLTLRRQAGELSAEVEARQASELALARSQSLLESLLHHTASVIYAKDLDGRYVLGNPAFEELVGLPGPRGDSGGDVIGRTDHDLFPPLLADQFRAHDLAIAYSGRSESYTEQLPTGDGTTHDYLSTKFALRDANGEIYAVAGVSTDVTELVEERRQHVESELRWRSLVEHSPVAVTIIRANGTYAYANPRAVQLYGVSVSAGMVDRPARDFIAPGREDETTSLFRGVLAGVPVLGRRWTLRRQGGECIDIVINAARVTYDGETAVQLELRDVTAQAAAERALRESERSWRTLFGASPVGIGLSNERGRFVSANAALCALLGRDETAVIGHSSAEFTHPDDLDSHRNATRLIESSKDGVLRIEKRYVRPDGDIRWAWLTIAHTPGPAGETWTLAHVQDVTERKASERAMVDSEANLRAVAVVVRRIQTGADARQTIVSAGVELAQAAHVSMVERTADGRALTVSASTHSELLGVSVPIDAKSAVAEVFRTGKVMFLADPAEHHLVDPARLELADARSLFVGPVRSGEDVTAAIVVAWQHRIDTLDDRRAGVLTLLADQAGVALRQAALVSQLEALALTDPLTGLPNRRSWDRHLDYLLTRSRRDGRPLTVGLVDLDHFKAFNDSRGHQAGDELLTIFAQAARAELRASDTIARWGGEEFVISLPECGPDDAEPVLDRVRSVVPMAQSCSIGYATWDGLESAAQLLARADRALYVAKANGRDRVQIASPAA